ncbi:MAG: betaine--homocysteine S-methyltransferase [Anaerolineales bacterium]|nr:betaine--homocysteine S-methyltransferase [Anaerolineales bacterium]MCB8940859.1 betaine--homocysteine S-methyltransferase [Ardenticatenaceae bacterium]
MTTLEQLMATHDYLIADGGLGTMLMAAGLEQGDPPEMWNILHPDRVRAIHRGYIEAGSQIVLTNSFGGTRFRLKLHNLQDRAFELNKAAAQLVRAEADAVAAPVVVGGSIGPTGEIMEPVGAMKYDEAVAAFAEQAAGLAAGGVDVLWIETMSDIREVQAAVEGCREATDLPVVATMTFDTNGRTMMGVTPAQAYAELSLMNLTALGGNCGNGPAEIEGVIQAMYAADQKFPFVAKSNAGIPEYVHGHLHYNGTPEVMADYAVKVRNYGARIIGACCGSTPAHIAAMREALAAAPIEHELVETAVATATPTRSRTRRRRG